MAVNLKESTSGGPALAAVPFNDLNEVQSSEMVSICIT